MRLFALGIEFYPHGLNHSGETKIRVVIRNHIFPFFSYSSLISQNTHCPYLIIVVASPSLPQFNGVQSPPSSRYCRWDLHVVMLMKTVSSSLRSSLSVPFIFTFSKKCFVVSILPCYLPLYSSEMKIFKPGRMMGIRWLRFISIYLDLKLNLKKIWFDLAWFRYLFNLD